MNGLIKHKADLMKGHLVQLLTILVMLAVFVTPATASDGSGALQDTLLNNVYENVKGNAEKPVMFIAGRKTKPGTRRPKYLKPISKETHEQMIAGKNPMEGNYGRIKRPKRITPKLVETPDMLIAGKKKNGGTCCRKPIKASLDEAQDLLIAGKKKKPGTSGRKPIKASLNEAQDLLIAGKKKKPGTCCRRLIKASLDEAPGIVVAGQMRMLYLDAWYILAHTRSV